ncbi:MAG TPA: DUF2785 domain-containing protein [Streptosporangiaceae bacterium]|nr:DUF2785 domain-containing protein [Streptosporangiaceae bacterium]
MTDWAGIAEAGYKVPAGHAPAEFVGELVEALGSPDPVLRDEQACPVLGTWVLGGQLDAELTGIGQRVTALLADPRIQARTFGALILAAVIRRDTKAGCLDAATVLAWRDRFADWWLAETDLRGWDEELGWLHAAAHGADVVGGLGQSPRLHAGDLAKLLQLASSRLLAPTSQVFAHQEDDRIALAVATVLARPELSADAATRWLDPIREYFDAAVPGPVPAPAANTMRTLRSLYVMADRGFRQNPRSADSFRLPHRAEVLEAVGDLLRMAFPHQL